MERSIQPANCLSSAEAERCIAAAQNFRAAGWKAAFNPRGQTLAPGKNADAAEVSQWHRPELAKEHSGGGQRWGRQRQRSVSHAAVTP